MPSNSLTLFEDVYSFSIPDSCHNAMRNVLQSILETNEKWNMDQLLSLTTPTLLLIGRDGKQHSKAATSILSSFQSYAKRLLQSNQHPSLSMLLTFLEVMRSEKAKDEKVKALKTIQSMLGPINSVMELQEACSDRYSEEEFEKVILYLSSLCISRTFAPTATLSQLSLSKRYPTVKYLETMTAILTNLVRVRSVGYFYQSEELTEQSQRLLMMTKSSRAYLRIVEYNEAWLGKQVANPKQELSDPFLSYKRLMLSIHDITGITPLFMGLTQTSPPDEKLFELLLGFARLSFKKWTDGNARWMEVVLYLVFTLEQMNSKSVQVAEIKNSARERLVDLMEKNILFSSKGWKAKSLFFSLCLLIASLCHQFTFVQHRKSFQLRCAQQTQEMATTVSFGKVTY